jgi:hypothetical protein
MVGLLDFFTGGDPTEMAQIDPRYGVARGDVSATLLAAGQPIMPAQRAQYLAQLGQVGSGINTDLYNSAQRRLMTSQMEQRRAEGEELKQIQDLMKNPEAFKARTGYDLQQFGGMRAQDISQALRQIRIQRLGQDPLEAEQRQLQVADLRRKAGMPLTREVGGVLYSYDESARRWTPMTSPRPVGGQAGEDRALINNAMHDPRIAETPEYLTAYNNTFGPRQVTAWNPQTQQMEYQWATPPVPPGIPQPRFQGVPQSAPPAGAGASDVTTPEAAAPPPPAAAMPPPGGTAPMIARPPQEERPLTEAQAKATGFAARMIQSGRVLDPMDSTPAAIPGFAETVLGSRLPEVAANYIRSEDRQRYRQAQENWVRANLRMESGAVIGLDEMNKEIENYFPRPGDSAAVIEQKRKSREAATQAMISSAGPGAQRAGLEFRPYEASLVDRIRSATPQDLLQMDTSTMNAREKAEYAARLRQLNRGR